MKSISIEELAYVIQQTKENKQPKPIFFLGAGASKTGGIPLANEIANDILDTYCKAPAIAKLKDEEKSYPKLMECLQPYERDTLLKDYIDAANINVTHIYLAQLMHKGYLDYVLTVNFDNLMLRALSLFNEFPATYDMAILKDLTTSTFKEKSVVFLHGQHHGLWLLNTPEEMNKVQSTVPRIFNNITDKRPWIFIGYSGNDPIFEHVKDLGRFDNGLYWVGYNDDKPNEKVSTFLETPNTNASIIKGYDADAFMLKLNSELNLGHPNIINKPFTSVKNMLNNIVDIDDEDHFKGVKERLRISKDQVNDAIKQFEESSITTSKKELTKQAKIDNLKRKFINWIVDEKYDSDKITESETAAKNFNDKELNDLLADLYYNWAANLIDQAQNSKVEKAEQYYQLAFNNYKQATTLKPKWSEALNNWAITTAELAQYKTGKESNQLFQKAIEKFEQADRIKKHAPEVIHNWGIYLAKFAENKNEIEAEALYLEALNKFKECINIAADNYKAFNSWGNTIVKLAQIKSGIEADQLYKQAFDKFKQAITIKPDNYEIWFNWGIHLSAFAKCKKGEEKESIYLQAFEKYQRTISIKPDYHIAYDKWGYDLTILAKSKIKKDADKLIQQAFDKYDQSILLGGGHYNLACLYANTGEKASALKLLETSLSKKEKNITADFVKKDEDWKEYLEDPEFKDLLEKYA